MRGTYGNHGRMLIVVIVVKDILSAYMQGIRIPQGRGRDDLVRIRKEVDRRALRKELTVDHVDGRWVAIDSNGEVIDEIEVVPPETTVQIRKR